jgi:2'-5' RNA ligase
MRMFFAIELSEEARKSVDTMAFVAKGTLPGKYVKADDYHITVAYVGEIEPARLDALKEIGMQAASGMAPCPLSLKGSGMFKGSILWAGVEGAQPFSRMAEDLKERLSAARFPFDPKPFRAHITVARDVKPDEFPLPQPDPASWTADCLTLFESTRVKGVLRYIPVERFPFR